MNKINKINKSNQIKFIGVWQPAGVNYHNDVSSDWRYGNSWWFSLASLLCIQLHVKVVSTIIIYCVV